MKCENCGKREATHDWLGHGSALDWSHGNYQKWCEVCVLKAQIEYNEEQLEHIPKFLEESKKRLKEILDKE